MMEGCRKRMRTIIEPVTSIDVISKLRFVNEKDSDVVDGDDNHVNLLLLSTRMSSEN